MTTKDLKGIVNRILCVRSIHFKYTMCRIRRNYILVFNKNAKTMKSKFSETEPKQHPTDFPRNHTKSTHDLLQATRPPKKNIKEEKIYHRENFI